MPRKHTDKSVFCPSIFARLLRATASGLFSLFMALMVFATTHVGSAWAEVPSVVSLGDVNGNGKPEVSVLLTKPHYYSLKNYAYVMDAGDGSRVSEVLFGDGSTIPDPISQAALPDINGNGAPEVAMLGVRPDDGSVVVLINDASTGAWIQTLGFDADFPPVAMAVVPDMDGNGISKIAVLGVRASDGKVMVLIKDVSTNGWIPSLTFDADYPPSAMKVVEYASGAVGIAVLGVNPTNGNVKVVVRDVSTRNKIGNAIYFDADYPPVDMSVVPDIDGNSEPEIAVLGIRASDGNVKVLIKDASSGDRVNAVFFDGSFSPVAMEVVPDINGSGSPEIALLGVNSTDGTVRVLVKDASSGGWIKTLGFGSNYPPAEMEVVPDMDGNGISEIAVLSVNSGNGRLEVVIKDASTDAKIKSFSLPFADVAALSAGDVHSMALKTNGTVWAWGYNRYGQLGNGTTTDSLVPLQVCAGGETAPCSSFLSDVTAIASGYFHSMAVKTNGTVWAWGANRYGQLGNGTTTDSLVPVQVCAEGETAPCSSFLTDVAAIVAGIGSSFVHTVALKTDGTVWAWGYNHRGQLGNGTTTTSYVPVQVCVGGETVPCSSWLTGVTGIAVGGHYSIALKTDGTVWTWGDNGYGQLGRGTVGGRYVPMQVSGLTNVATIAAGYRHSIALKSDGTVWAWGDSWSGQLGGALYTCYYNEFGEIYTCYSGTPGQTSLTDVTAISAGEKHNVAVKTDGTLWAWGYNGYGQLGTTMDVTCGPYSDSCSSTPVQVCAEGETASPCSSFLSDVTGITAGGKGHSMALKSDGTVWAWGYNNRGTLGDGTTTDSNVPVQVISDPWLP